MNNGLDLAEGLWWSGAAIDAVLHVAHAVLGTPGVTTHRLQAEFSPSDEFIGVTAEDIKGPMVTWMPPQSTLTVPLVLDKTPNVPVNYPLRGTSDAPLRPTMRGYAGGPQYGVRDVEELCDGARPESFLQISSRYSGAIRIRDPTAGESRDESRTIQRVKQTQPQSWGLDPVRRASELV